MTRYFYGASSETYYAKPEPIVASPWGTDAVTGTENGTTGSFAFTISSPNAVIYQQLGEDPADTDPIVGWFDSPEPGLYPHVKVTRPDEVVWTWVKDAVDVETTSPTIDILDRTGTSLIGGAQAATVNATATQHRYTAPSSVFTSGNQYWIVLAATIDGIAVSQSVPVAI